MVIYKITNQVNGKIYIGQTTQELNARFQKHISAAIRNEYDTHLARAIKKYGKGAFKIEIIDFAKTKKELNEKEELWIKYYNSTNENIGYNETCGAIGGNTYKLLPKDKLRNIKKKISVSKQGSKNPNASSVKVLNIETNEEIVFDTVKECKEYFKEKNHNFITRRCSGKTNYLYKGKYIFAYKDEEYKKYSKSKNIRNKKKIQVYDMDSKIEKEFESYTKAEKYFGLNRGAFSGKAYMYKNAKSFILRKKYKITILN